LLIYRTSWKKLTLAALVAASLYGLIRGPLYTSLSVAQPGFSTVGHILMHHISAHINIGQPLSAENQALADSILPSGEWGYSCCSARSTSRSPGFLDIRSSTQGPAIQKLFLNLALQEPAVELTHLRCISSIAWRSPGFCGATSLLPYDSALWIDPGQKLIKEESLLPSLREPITRFLLELRLDPDLTLFASPAVYLWLGVYSTAILAIRRKDWRIALYILPVILQAVVYVLINLSDQFRYHYGSYLTGLFSVGLLILSLYSSKEK
jgi:hypothetical protein